jgi:hypothetical protein
MMINLRVDNVYGIKCGDIRNNVKMHHIELI